MLLQELKNRNLPELKSREEMIEILQSEIYGKKLPDPEKVEFIKEAEPMVPRFCANKASIYKVTAKCTLNGKEFSFPFYEVLPNDNEKHPFFIHVNFRDDNPDRYQPTEEIIDNGFAVLTVCYTDVTSDDDDFTNGLAGVLFPDGKRQSDDSGKIAMWAWAASRLLDYAETLSHKLDLEKSVICGHSRLGKTALVAAMFDERFKFSYSNDSGCSGAALARGTTGETVEDICDRFPFWFCENYKKYVNNEENMPFDQHYLIASIAPRYVLIGSAKEDAWAHPQSEQLACVAASPAFKNPFDCENKFAEAGDEFFNGDLGYHMRNGTHYFSREDWQKLIKFAEGKIEN
ncbi:MAG: hypothetical protein IKK46_01870 [Clostridia bacterium]|nr:hypothetical protein [Clostridia bacterium]